MNLSTTFDATRRDYPPYENNFATGGVLPPKWCTVGSTADSIVLKLSEEKPKPNIEDYLPTVDQLNYTIHCLSKQETKLTHALKQVHTTISKLEILKGYLQDKEKLNGTN